MAVQQLPQRRVFAEKSGDAFFRVYFQGNGDGRTQQNTLLRHFSDQLVVFPDAQNMAHTGRDRHNAAAAYGDSVYHIRQHNRFTEILQICNQSLAFFIFYPIIRIAGFVRL